MRKRAFISVLVLLITAASLYSASFISSPAATVNLIRNTAITEEQLDEEYQRYVDMGAAGVTKSDVLQTLINDEVFLQGAERDGISVSDRQVDQMYQQVKANAEQQAGGPISDADFEAEVVRQFGSVEAYRQALKEQTIINQYMAEMRDREYQQNRLLFRNNIMRVGEMMAYEISKTLSYAPRAVETPLGTAEVSVPTDKVVLATIFRAGLPFHTGFLNVFDHAGNAFVSAYREYTDERHTEVGIHVEYLATPSVEGKTLIIVDPMLATGGSMELGYKAFLTRGTPKRIHVACVIAAPEGIEHVKKTFPDDKTTLWCAAIDPGMNEHKYIVPGFGDAGDLCYGDKV